MTLTEQIGNNPERERAMQKAFQLQVTDVVQSPDRFIKKPGVLRVGFEMEASIVDTSGSPVSEHVRDSIQAQVPSADPELGAAQIEWRTDPIVLNVQGGLAQLVQQARERDMQMAMTASQHNAKILRVGTQPLIPLERIERTSKPKYQKVPDFHNAHRTHSETTLGIWEERVDVNNAAVVALLNSLQSNIEASSLADAVDLTNRSLMIGPWVVALSGNARFLAGKDTMWNDVRATAWEVTHDTRSEEERKQGKGLRIGLPVDYFSSIEDYFERVGSHPFILDDEANALRIGIGLFWQDTRIKIIDDSAVVEFRPVSIQPTVEEDIAVMLFYLGRLKWSQLTQETLIPIDEVRERRALAMQVGILPFAQELSEELQRAQEALEYVGMSREELLPFFSILNDRVKAKKTPADVFAEKVHGFSGEREDALKIALGI